MRKLIGNNEASVIPTFLFLLLGGFASFIMLILNEVLEPLINTMPDSPLKLFFSIVMPYGFMLGIFFALTFAYLLRMQKTYVGGYK